MLRVIYKHYGGIEFFRDKEFDLFVECLENAVKKENEIPKLILEFFNALNGETISSYFPKKRELRSEDDILKDYGMK